MPRLHDDGSGVLAKLLAGGRVRECTFYQPPLLMTVGMPLPMAQPIDPPTQTAATVIGHERLTVGAEKPIGTMSTVRVTGNKALLSFGGGSSLANPRTRTCVVDDCHRVSCVTSFVAAKVRSASNLTRARTSSNATTFPANVSANPKVVAPGNCEARSGKKLS